MQRFHLDLGTAAYDILFAPGLLARTGELMREAALEGKVALVTSPTVAALYGNKVIDSLAAAGYTVHPCHMPEGEAYKNLSTAQQLYDAFLDAAIERGDTVVALGGGVIGDTAGFAAATYMRGVPFVQVPTTLLAQVDASIGGKVAVDHPRAKNIIGAFYQPKLVISDPQTLETLPPEEFRGGMAEVIKAGMIRSPRLFTHLEKGGAEPLAAVVEQAIAVKVAIVAADPYERGLRALLNLGHTVGHAIEAVSNYQLRHGDAVSVGMIAATRMAIALGICEPKLEQRLSRLLHRFGLPVSIGGVDPDAVWQAMAADKKRKSGRLRLVLPVQVGEVVLRDDVPEDVARQAIASVLVEQTSAGDVR